MDYRSYIKSAVWRQNPARLAELAASGFRCRVCNNDGAESPLEVHHRTYANLGNEQIGDLTTLCRCCHRLVTEHQRRLRYALTEVRSSNVRPALESPPSLFDPTFKEMM